MWFQGGHERMRVQGAGEHVWQEGSGCWRACGQHPLVAICDHDGRQVAAHKLQAHLAQLLRMVLHAHPGAGLGLGLGLGNPPPLTRFCTHTQGHGYQDCGTSVRLARGFVV